MCLSITDNGPGATSEQLKALYNETAITDSRHGLGLHIIRDLIKAIGCSIVLRANEGCGTVFVINFKRTESPFHNPASASDN